MHKQDGRDRESEQRRDESKLLSIIKQQYHSTIQVSIVSAESSLLHELIPRARSDRSRSTMLKSLVNTDSATLKMFNNTNRAKCLTLILTGS